MPLDHGFPFSGIELGWNSFLFSFVIVAAKGLIWLIGFGIGLGKTGFFFSGGNLWWSVWDWAKMITCLVINWLYFFMELLNFDVLRIVQFGNCLVIKDENVQR